MSQKFYPWYLHQEDSQPHLNHLVFSFSLGNLSSEVSTHDKQLWCDLKSRKGPGNPGQWQVEYDTAVP